MKDEKLLKEDLLSDKQLEQVVGGNSLDEYWQDRFITWLQDEGFEDYIVYSSLPKKGQAGYTWKTLTNTFDKYGIEWEIHDDIYDSSLFFKINGQWHDASVITLPKDRKEVLDYFRNVFTGK